MGMAATYHPYLIRAYYPSKHALNLLSAVLTSNAFPTHYHSESIYNKFTRYNTLELSLSFSVMELQHLR